VNKSEIDAIIDQEVAKMVKAIAQKANPLPTLTLKAIAADARSAAQKTAERSERVTTLTKAVLNGCKSAPQIMTASTPMPRRSKRLAVALVASCAHVASSKGAVSDYDLRCAVALYGFRVRERAVSPTACMRARMVEPRSQHGSRLMIGSESAPIVAGPSILVRFRLTIGSNWEAGCGWPLGEKRVE
jgi:hypothetical protein